MNDPGHFDNSTHAGTIGACGSLYHSYGDI